MSSEYLVGTITGLIGGIGGTIVGFLLFVLYDRRTHKKTEQQTKLKILTMLKSELKDNLRIAEVNQSLLSQDIALISERKGIIQSLAFYEESSWHIAQANDIYSCIGDEAYKLLADAYVSLSYSNAHLASRESYITFNGAMSNYNQNLLSHDQALIIELRSDIEKITKGLEGLGLSEKSSR